MVYALAKSKTILALITVLLLFTLTAPAHAVNYGPEQKSSNVWVYQGGCTFKVTQYNLHASTDASMSNGCPTVRPMRFAVTATGQVSKVLGPYSSSTSYSAAIPSGHTPLYHGGSAGQPKVYVPGLYGLFELAEYYI